MHVVFVSQEYPPETAHGGIATQTHAKARGLASLGHRVHVISHSVDAGRHATRRDGIDVIRIPGYDAQLELHADPARWVGYSLLVAQEIARLHHNDPIDVLDFPEWGCEAYVHLLNRSAWHHIPTAIHLQGPLVMLAHTIGWPEPGSALYLAGTAMEQTCLRLADAIASSSRCSARWVGERYGLDAAAIPVLHTGVDTAVFHPGVAAPDPYPSIVFVGRIALSKGVDTLVQAACTVAGEFPGLQLRLIGRAEPALRDQLLRQARDAGFPDLLEFTGPLAHAALPAELCRAHVFAAPSRYEGGPGFVYLEAMACGLPVIACSGSGAAESVRDGATGVLVPPSEAVPLAAQLRRLLADETGRARLGAAARAFVVAHAELHTCARAYARFLAAVAASGAPR